MAEESKSRSEEWEKTEIGEDVEWVLPLTSVPWLPIQHTPLLLMYGY